MILAIDQGTTGTTRLVFDERRQGRRRARYARVPAALPAPGLGRARPRGDLGGHAARWPRGARATPASTAPTRGDRHHQPARDRRSSGTARPASRSHRAIVWQDRRTAARCDELPRPGLEALVRERTGLVLDPYFSGTKIEWLLARAAATAARRAALRHHRHLAALEAHRRRARDRRHQRLAHAALRHPRAALGRRAARAARRPARRAARAACRQRRGLRRDRREFGGDGPDRRDRRRPAGGAVRPGLLRRRGWPRTPTAPAASC